MGEVREFPQSARSVSSLTRFVRVTNPDHRGFVEFNFSIGDPEIYLEMILARPAFEEFCKEQGAVLLTPEQEQAVDHLDARWQYGESASSSEEPEYAE
jgi:phenol hydroxylase P0 protein